MTQKLQILGTLPGVGIHAIKDAGRNIALGISQKQPIADKVGVTLKNILRTDGIGEVSSTDAQEICALIQAHRNAIIELLQDKECIKQFHGHSKREKNARIELSQQILDEVLDRVVLSIEKE